MIARHFTFVPMRRFALRPDAAVPAYVPAFRRIQKRRGDAGPDESLFLHHHRDSFRELLTACGMRQTDRGLRDSKSLRPTGISLRLDKGPKNIDSAIWQKSSELPRR